MLSQVRDSLTLKSPVLQSPFESKSSVCSLFCLGFLWLIGWSWIKMDYSCIIANHSKGSGRYDLHREFVIEYAVLQSLCDNAAKYYDKLHMARWFNKETIQKRIKGY